MKGPSRALLSFLAFVARTLAYGWLLALVDLLRRLCEILRRRRSRPAGRGRKLSPNLCNPISEPAFRRPDPLIYSQGELMALGLAVTWDNPDVVLRRNGVDVPSSQLDPNTEYEIVARIWNRSTDAPVASLPVRFSYLSFGIGAQSRPIGVTAVSLGVRGGPDHPALARMKWTTPPAGHYCLQVLLDPADDSNFANNLGQENTEVGTAHSPAGFEFLLRNGGGREEAFRFELDAYSIPEPPPCGERPSVAPVRPASGVVTLPRHPVPAHHDRANHPVPDGWSVVLDPSEPRLAAEAETTVRVTVTPPDGFRGRQPLNVSAFDERGFVGGVTLYVERA